MALDPVCGMEVNPDEAPASARYEGQTYFFCSEDCYHDFMQEPEEFLEEGARDETG